jgi:hypothetical protein
VFCIDGSKLNRQAPHFLLSWEQVDMLLTDLSNERLVRAGISLPESKRIPVRIQPESRAISDDAATHGDASGEGDFPIRIL